MLPFASAACACCASSGFAQQTSDDVAFEEQAIEEIVVTGSRIKRRDFSSPSPLATIEREVLESTGRATLEETLNLMPQVQPDSSRALNNGGDGTAAINLRGIGAGRTLVLMNGRRVAPSGTGSAVDINNLPQSLIERVEIITGGASTVYGSDAIAGVVNLITRDDFRGLALDASYSLSAESDAQIYDINLSYGQEISDGKGNVALYAGFYDREELLAGSRTLTNKSIANDDATGEVFESGAVPPPAGLIFAPLVDFGSGPNGTTFNPDGVPREFVDPDDRYNFRPINYLQTPLRRTTAGLLGNFEVSANYEIYVEAGVARNEATLQFAEVPAIDFAVVNTDNPVLTREARQFFEANYAVEPGVALIGVGRRLSELGPRRMSFERNYWRAVAGVRGELGAGWDIDAWLTYARSDETEHLLNDALASRFRQGLLVDPVTGQCFDPSNGCVPLDIFGEGRLSAEAASFLRIDGVQNDSKRTQQLASIVVTGSPVDTWAGELNMAFGAEWRSDSAMFEADDILFSGDTLGFRGAAPVEGKETVGELYTEAVIPLVRDAAWANDVALEIGARYSDYDNAGTSWTYKYGASWAVTDTLRFRVMRQRSVRAPNNGELFTENFTETGFFVGNVSSDDPCSASNDPVALGYLEKCVIQGLPAEQVGVFEAFAVATDFIFGGNPSLEPETADTLTAGVVILPWSFDKWQISLDYFEIDVADSIGDIDPVAICFDARNAANLFCDNITRDVNAGYNVVQVFAPQSNRGRITSRGIDTQVTYRSPLPDAFSWFGSAADFELGLFWTYTLENSWQLNLTTGVIECSGLFGEFCPIEKLGQGTTIPENRVSSRLSYVTDRLGIHLLSRWIQGSQNSRFAEAEFVGQPPPLLAVPSVGSRTYLDLSISYELARGLNARLGVNNLTSTDAPLMPGLENNTDALLYDVFGRSYFLSFFVRIFE